MDESFTCELCNYDSQRKQNFERHLKSTKHANNVAKREKEEHDAKEQRKHFVCPKCSKRFATNQKLTRHTNRAKPCVGTAMAHHSPPTSELEPCRPQYVYLIRERTAVIMNQSIYKIGKTTQKNFSRFNGYGKGYEVFLHIACIDCHAKELTIMSSFADKYRHATEYGKEYFEGDRNEMMRDICNIVFA